MRLGAPVFGDWLDIAFRLGFSARGTHVLMAGSDLGAVDGRGNCPGRAMKQRPVIS
jgi:hypothetical protein